MKNMSKKILILSIIVVILSIFIIPMKNIYAATTYTQTLKSGIESFPEEYKTVLEQIQKLHPNWTFEAYYTGIPWNTVVLNETASHGRNRVITSSDLCWKCTCGNVASGYACASEGIVKYYLDSRNFLNEVNIFQFLEISYNEKIHNVEGIKSAVKGTFLDSEITYTVIEKKEVEVEKEIVVNSEENNENIQENNIITTENTDVVNTVEENVIVDTTKTSEIKTEIVKEIQEVEVEYTKHYAEIILEAAKQSNMSPYSIVTKIIQEVGTKGSSSVSGTYEGYTGYYNFYNLGAYDTGNAIANGLRYARDKGWNNQYKAIIEGAKEIANSYTNAGQNTAYFYKWDVVGTKILESGSSQNVSSSNMFWHQYMTNVQDPTSQSKSLYNTYAKNGVLDKALNFIIPIYENMPKEFISKPSGLTTEDGDLYYVNCTDGLAVRQKPTTAGERLLSLSKNTIVAMLERECAEADGYKWDKVKLANGVTGYIASKYLTLKEASIKQEYKYEETETENIIIMTLGITLEKIEGGTAVGEIKTGAKIKIGEKEYTAVVLGDINSDGSIDTGDTFKLKQAIMEVKEISDKSQIKAADLNNDGLIDTGDSFILKKHIKEVEKISIK